MGKASSTPGVPFAAHVELLQFFLVRRERVVAGIERLLNCQKKPAEYQQELALLSRRFKDSVFAIDGLTAAQRELRDQLELAHRATPFKPREKPGNDIVDPAAMMQRAFHMWQQTRWPGARGRIRFAHTLFNLYLIRCLALLSLRLWDEDPGGAAGRLAQLEAVLDKLWQTSPADQPRLVRDVRWLTPVAVSPTADDLSGYFDLVDKIASHPGEGDRVETQKAWVVTGAGHLRSQLRHLSVQRGLPFDDHNLTLITRRSNALDVALLMEGLVTLLESYEKALQSGDEARRRELAEAICQGISPDPELFVNRTDLLGPYSMIEYLFIAADDEGKADYTAMGRRHLRRLAQYTSLIARLAKPLLDDCRRCAVREGGYSPFGALYGFSSNILELMAFRTLMPEPAAPFSMEDVFSIGGSEKRAWLNGWRRLPHVRPEVAELFEYPEDFAAAIGARIEPALARRASEAGAGPGGENGRLAILPEGEGAAAELSKLPDLPLRYIVSSDAEMVAAGKAECKDQEDLLHCRLEGEFLVSHRTRGGWFAITKDVLSDVMGAGHDAKIAGLPPAVGEVLRLMSPDLIA